LVRSNKSVSTVEQTPRTRRIAAVLGAVFYLLVALASAPASAGRPTLGLPADCRVGETCWLVNLVDHDPGPGHRDYRCGPLTYDTHKGTDIAIADDAAMRRGVAVLAAAPGRVVRVRDGMPASTERDLRSPDALRGRECGNGVVIDHGDGWTTQYCHMKAGTLTVATGSEVARGDRLGDIGRSGRSEFPHIHIAVRHGNSIVDPFTAGSQAAVCNPNATVGGLWSDKVQRELTYPGPQPYHLGFAAGKPSIAAIRAGRLADTRFSKKAPALVFWAEIFSLDAKDRIALTLVDPNGKVLAGNTVEPTRFMARYTRFVGLARPASGWTVGTYTGRVSVTRRGRTTSRDVRAVIE